METVNSLLLGIEVAFTLQNFLFCLLGVTIGTLVGVLPGLGPIAAISLLLPFTFQVADPATSLIFLAGIYYGTQYGGSTTSILLKLPGESSSVVTAIDGYKMTQQGRAGNALVIAAVGSFVAGTVATLFIALLGEPLSKIIFYFGPAEYTSLILFGLIAAVTLSPGDNVKGLIMVLIGMLLSMIGTDINSGIPRFTFSNYNLMDGISFGIVAMAIFGLAELMYNILHLDKVQLAKNPTSKLTLSKQDIKESSGPILRGTLLGSFLGTIPGAGVTISAFASYALEKKISKTPSKFGEGAIEGVAGPESANNAAAQTGFLPMLSIGLPATPVMALMLAALISHGIQPGPNVISNNPELFWGLIVSMWLGNLFLIILNIPLIGIWISILKIDWKILYPLIVLICIFGSFYISNNWFMTLLLIPLTLLGYIFKILKFEPAPLAMGFVLGGLFEEQLRRSLMISRGDWFIFLDRPLSLTFILITVSVLILSILYKADK